MCVRARPLSRTLLALGATLALAGAVVGCGSDDTSSADTGTSTGTSELAGKTLGIAVPTLAGPFFVPEVYGAMDEAEKAGMKTTVVNAGGYDKGAVQVQQIEDLIAKGVDALVIEPIDPNALKPVLERAIESGIKIVAVGLPPTDLDLRVFDLDHREIGRTMGQAMVDALPDGGSVIAEPGPAGVHWTSERLAGFKEAIEGSGIEVIAEQASPNTVEEGVKITETLLSRHPDVDGIYAVDNGLGAGAARVLEQTGRAGDVKVVAAVLDRDVIKYLRDGTITAVAAIEPVTIGRETAGSAIKLLRGEDVPERSTIEVKLVTSDTVDSVADEALFAPEGFRP